MRPTYMTRFSRESLNSSKSNGSLKHILLGRRPLWVALFFVSVVFAGCKKPEQGLGLGLQPEDDLLSAFQTDTTTLVVNTIKEDSLATDELSQSLLGNYFDPATGLTRASFYSQLRLATPDHDFGPNPVADSLVLGLLYTGDTWGSLQTQFFEVYEVMEALSVDSTYYSNRTFEVVNDNLVQDGSELLSFDLNSTLFFADSDSAEPQLRIPLDQTLADRLITAGSEVYDSNESWLDYFKGLYVRSSSGGGGVVNLDLVDSQSSLRLYYHNDTDTAFFDFVINSSCARVNRFEHLFGGDLYALNYADEVDGSQQSWVQAGGAVKTRIRMPHLDDYNAHPERTINKAELIIPVTDAFDDRNPYQSLLFLLTVNEDDEAIGLPGQLSTTVDIGGNYDAVNNEYRFNISRWLQEYLNGNMAVDYVNLVSNNAGISVRSVKVNGPLASEEEPEDNMRLIITYSY